MELVNPATMRQARPHYTVSPAGAFNMVSGSEKTTTYRFS
jgi:hypothetical protein